jgi:hypothetical protein
MSKKKMRRGTWEEQTKRKGDGHGPGEERQATPSSNSHVVRASKEIETDKSS